MLSVYEYLTVKTLKTCKKTFNYARNKSEKIFYYLFFVNICVYFLVSAEMTRFARAKGSKASNEKLPNEATPWHLMKQQLEENKTKELPEKKKSAKELLRDRQDSDIFKNSSTEWAEFDSNKSENARSMHKKHKSHKNVTESSRNDDTAHNITTKNNNIEKLKKKDKNIEKTEKKNKFSDKKQANINTNAHSESNNKESITLQNNTSSNFVVLSKRQKRNLKRKLEKSNNDDSKKFTKDMSNENSQSKVKEKKIKNNGEYKRRKPDSTSIQTIIINGVETEIVKYDGFPIKKEDAERLAKLKQELLMKGKCTALYKSFYVH